MSKVIRVCFGFDLLCSMKLALHSSSLNYSGTGDRQVLKQFVVETLLNTNTNMFGSVRQLLHITQPLVHRFQSFTDNGSKNTIYFRKLTISFPGGGLIGVKTIEGPSSRRPKGGRGRLIGGRSLIDVLFKVLD